MRDSIAMEMRKRSEKQIYSWTDTKGDTKMKRSVMTHELRGDLES